MSYVKRLIAVVIVCVAWVLVSMGSASAAPIPAPANPLVNCREAPQPQAATAGNANAIDPPSGTSTGTKYTDAGWAGLRWHTYDFGCLPGIESSAASADTALGNIGLETAAVVAASTSQVHKMAARPGAVLRPFDDMLVRLTSTLKAALYDQWAVLAFVMVGVTILVSSLSGRLAESAQAVLWMATVSGAVVILLGLPAAGLTVFDNTVSGITSDVDSRVSGLTDLDGGVSGDGHASLMMEYALYNGWLRGTFGTSVGPDVERLAPALWEAQRLTYDEVKAVEAGDRAIIDAKRDDWKKAMGAIKDARPDMYETARGANGGRAIAGLVTATDAVIMALFVLLADGFKLVCLIVLRLMIPLVAVMGAFLLHPAAAPQAKKIMTVFIACIINSALLGVAATVFILIESAVFSSNIPFWGANVRNILAFVLLIIALWICWPLLDLRKIAGIGGDRLGGGLLRRAGMAAASYRGAAWGARRGSRTTKEEAPMEYGDNAKRLEATPQRTALAAGRTETKRSPAARPAALPAGRTETVQRRRRPPAEGALPSAPAPDPTGGPDSDGAAKKPTVITGEVIESTDETPRKKVFTRSNTARVKGSAFRQKVTIWDAEKKKYVNVESEAI